VKGSTIILVLQLHSLVWVGLFALLSPLCVLGWCLAFGMQWGYLASLYRSDK
jgi:hypothetical protein